MIPSIRLRRAVDALRGAGAVVQDRARHRAVQLRSEESAPPPPQRGCLRTRAGCRPARRHPPSRRHPGQQLGSQCFEIVEINIIT